MAGLTNLISPPLAFPLRLGTSLSGKAHISPRLDKMRHEDLRGSVV